MGWGAVLGAVGFSHPVFIVPIGATSTTEAVEIVVSAKGAAVSMLEQPRIWRSSAAARAINITLAVDAIRRLGKCHTSQAAEATALSIGHLGSAHAANTAQLDLSLGNQALEVVVERQAPTAVNATAIDCVADDSQ